MEYRAGDVVRYNVMVIVDDEMTYLDEPPWQATIVKVARNGFVVTDGDGEFDLITEDQIIAEIDAVDPAVLAAPAIITECDCGRDD